MRVLLIFILVFPSIWACDVCSGVLGSTNYGLGLNNQIQNRIYFQLISSLNHYGEQNQYLLGRYPIKSEQRYQFDMGGQWQLGKRWQIKAGIPLKFYQAKVKTEFGNEYSSYERLGDLYGGITFALWNKVDSVKDRKTVFNTSFLIQLPTGKSHVRDEINQWKYHPLAQPGLGAYTIGLEAEWSTQFKKQALHGVVNSIYGFENENNYKLNLVLNGKIGYMYVFSLGKKNKFLPGVYLGMNYAAPAEYKGVRDLISEQTRAYVLVQNVFQLDNKWNFNLGFQYQVYQTNSYLNNIQSFNGFAQFWYSF